MDRTTGHCGRKPQEEEEEEARSPNLDPKYKSQIQNPHSI